MESHHVLSGFNRALSLDQLTTHHRQHDGAAPLEGLAPIIARLKGEHPGCLDDRGVPEPSSGLEPDPPAYEAGARAIELQGHALHGERDQLQRKESNLRRTG